MEKPTLESLQQELERQDRELAEAIEALAGLDLSDVPRSFFDELDAICAPPVASSAALTVNVFGVRA